MLGLRERDRVIEDCITIVIAESIRLRECQLALMATRAIRSCGLR